ncbi:TMV resistance protein N [Cucurbita maxima]|uniref:ADP-ribosyl cyclase/cyclic ADP-ribose hydrolase n=1 Tax=Cucurbita maxima TaxID=3661 RepID=A0A6J1J021_CUCMA|nr:TMV resistance protein N [Cucurbita maxima]
MVAAMVDDPLRPQHGGWIYDVFLSFRGEDTRKNFTDHLYHALIDAGLNVFRDDPELQQGEDITSELERAIQGSKVAVIVFSQNYADSRWCLEELVKIMECRRTLRQLVLPIFYDVDPSTVRKQMGGFEEAFLRHEQRFFTDIDRVLRWRMALSEAANLSGWDLRNIADGHEAKFIRLIVEKISRELNSTYLFIALYPVGIESRVKVVASHLDIGSNGVRFVGILGMGGMGKTTIAKALYNQLYHNFEAKCFLANIKDISKQPNGQIRLQEQLLSSVTKSTKIKLENVDRGIVVLQERLRCKKVLLILDDVDEIGQLNAIARSREWFGPGSRIVLTTRDQHLLNQLEADGICSVDEMDDTEALELFSWHAFRNSYPLETFHELSKRVVNYSGGLPLALEVLGSFLFGRSRAEWEVTLNKLKKIPDDQIQRKLRISFDGLNDHTYKDIFLDVSCFFIGMDKNYVEQVLDGCGSFPKIGISVLLQRCLLTIGDKNKLMMHDFLRDMGREIVREKFPKEPEKHSRLVLHEEVISVLSRHKGTYAIEGLSLKLPRFSKEKLSSKAFNEMQNLRLLQLNFVNLTGDFKHISQEIRWLCWHGFPLKFLPKDFHMEKLVAVDLRYSQIRFFWKESKFLKNLKFLNLSHSHYLTYTPDFSKLPNLETLKLKDCKSLVELHPTIGELKALILINLKDCKCLKSLPKGFSMLKSLETLILSGCSKLSTLPEDLGEMVSLITLTADDTAIQRIPSTIVKLKKLKYLSLCGCKGPPSKSFPSAFWSWISPTKYPNSSLLPSSLQGLNSLRTLRLKNCNLSNNTIPKDIGSLISLRELDLRDNSFHSLPSSISGLLKLETLMLDHCNELQCIPDLPPHLNSLYASNCISLERAPDLSNVKRMVALSVSNCPKLMDIPGLEMLLDSIRVIHMEGCSNMSSSFKESILLGWTVSGFGGVCVPGKEIPDWFAYKDEGHSVFFDLPQFTDCNLEGFIVCIVYSSCFDNAVSSDLPSLSVINYTKGVITTNKPLTNDVVMSTEDHLWQGHLSNKTFKMEAGDEVEIIINFGAEITVKKIGISLVFDKYVKRKMLEFGSTSNDDDGVVNNRDGDVIENEGGVGSKRGCDHDDEGPSDWYQLPKRLKYENNSEEEQREKERL